MSAKLAWNAIVKNEAAVIGRCLDSLLPHVDCGVVVDTGSTDDTVDIIAEKFRLAGKPIEFHHVPFVNFEESRNKALFYARTTNLKWDYLLLVDADMELKVTKPDWVNGAKGLSYDVKQIAGSLGYYNRRLVSRDATGWYCGVTHEYLDVPTAGVLDGAVFVDHADGANRPDKIGRDIALLEEALKTETRPGLIQRYHFYLAGSYYDVSDFASAAEHYRLRVSLGGFEEERWYAQMRYAMCLERMGHVSGFLAAMLQAHQMRSTRSEPLYELAHFYRERGDNHTSLLFSKPGMAMPKPDDQLFVNDWVYSNGLKEEFAICAYYDLPNRKQGAAVCNELSLRGSSQARGNMFWYLQPLVQHVPSFRPVHIEMPLPHGWVATNPSVINHLARPRAIVRTVNYTITPEGMYSVLGADGSFNRHHPIRTRNYLVGFDRELKVSSSHELFPPISWPEPKFPLVIGFEDSRLFEYQGQLWTSSTVRELTEDGVCQQVVAALVSDGYADDWIVFESHQNTHEKNWMPWVREGEIQFVHRLGSLISTKGGHGAYHRPNIDPSCISGGSQVIEANGYYLALVHEAGHIPGRPYNRYYQHRFVQFVHDGELKAISPPFVFHDRQIEFAAGLAYFVETNKLVASYGVRDCEAWLAEMDLNEVMNFIAEGTCW